VVAFGSSGAESLVSVIQDILEIYFVEQKCCRDVGLQINHYVNSYFSIVYCEISWLVCNTFIEIIIINSASQHFGVVLTIFSLAGNVNFLHFI
jgi:hypothetical protein